MQFDAHACSHLRVSGAGCFESLEFENPSLSPELEAQVDGLCYDASMRAIITAAQNASRLFGTRERTGPRKVLSLILSQWDVPWSHLDTEIISVPPEQNAAYAYLACLYSCQVQDLAIKKFTCMQPDAWYIIDSTQWPHLRQLHIQSCISLTDLV